MIKICTILTLIISFQIHAFCYKKVVNDSLFTVNNVENSWVKLEERSNNIPLNNVINSKKWVSVNKFPQSFSNDTKAVWLKTNLVNNTDKNQSIRIITKGIDSLNAYWSNGSKKYYYYTTGKYISLLDRNVPSQFLVVPVNLLPHSCTSLYIRIYNQGYHLSLPYLKILNEHESNRFIKLGEFGYNVYFGGLLLMILFCTILFIFFQERLYFYYLCCLVISFGMAFIYNDYYYIFIQQSPEFFRNKNVFAVLSTLINIFYLLFAEQYLKIETNKANWIIKFSRIIITILIFLLFYLIFVGKELFNFRNLFYPLFSINTIIMYYHLVNSLKKKYSPSWYFLIATTPIALVSMLEITSDYNHIPIQTMHDFYYTGTFVEMFFLTIGIVYRFRLERTNAQVLQQELFVTEIKTQDRERERIAKDLHDNIGASIVGVQYQLIEFAEKYFDQNNTPEDLQKTIFSLTQAYKDVQGLSHDLTPQILTNMGLTEQIRHKYGSIKKPVFKLSLPHEPLNLEPFVDLTLYKIINEAVLNILKHAKSTEVGIDLEVDKKMLKLRIDDNGIGFDLNQSKFGMGLSNIKFRVESQLNGTLSIESSPGNGTIILVKVLTKNLSKKS